MVVARAGEHEIHGFGQRGVGRSGLDRHDLPVAALARLALDDPQQAAIDVHRVHPPSRADCVRQPVGVVAAARAQVGHALPRAAGRGLR